MTVRRKHFWFFLIVLVVILFGSCCVHIEPSHHGIVSDAETEEPLKDVLVYLGLDYVCYFPPNPAGSSHEFLGFQETYTDEKGEYLLPRKLYWLPPNLCFTDQGLAYFKAGYFLAGNPTKLYKMTHYLNYLPYKKPASKHHNVPYFDVSNLLSRSESYQKALEQIGAMELFPTEEKGVFLRLPGRKLTRMYAKKLIISHIGGMVYYVFDEASGSWLTIDSRGKMLEDKTANFPKWDYMDAHRSHGNFPIYASKNSIFYPEISYHEGEIKYIIPCAGNISALVGTADNFFTIEDDGRLLCHYKRRQKSVENYDLTKQNKDNSVPYFFRSVKVEDLPDLEQDDTLKQSIFKYVTYNSTFVTKTPKYWHLYKFYPFYDKKLKEYRQRIREIASFSAKREIVAFTAGNDGLYIAFKNEGIRKYSHPPFYFSSKIVFKENELFFKNSQESMPPDVCSIVVGSAVNLQAIYVTAGDDKIFRLSLDGIPDYRVK